MFWPRRLSSAVRLCVRLANSWRRPPWLQCSVSSIVTTGFAQRVRWFSDSDCLWCTYLSLLPLAVALIAVVFLFPVGFSAPRVVMMCQSNIYSLGRCTVGWTYMLYIVGTALSIVAVALSWTPIRSRKRSGNEDPIPYNSWKSDEKLSPDATAAATFECLCNYPRVIVVSSRCVFTCVVHMTFYCIYLPLYSSCCIIRILVYRINTHC